MSTAFDADNAATFPRSVSSSSGTFSTASSTVPRQQRPISAVQVLTPAAATEVLTPALVRPATRSSSADIASTYGGDAAGTVTATATTQKSSLDSTSLPPASASSTTSLNSLAGGGAQAASPALQQPLKAFAKQHTAQLKALQARNADDVALAELMREYFKRRAELEQAMCADVDKLTRTFLAKSVAIGLASGAQLTANAGPVMPAAPAQATQRLRRASLNVRGERPNVSVKAEQPLSAGNAPAASKQTAATGAAPSPATATVPTAADMSAGGGGALSLSLSRTVHQAFHALLLETQTATRARSQLYESKCTQLTDRLKEWNHHKLARIKKVCDNAAKIQAELFAEYSELDKTKKAYDEAYTHSQALLEKYTAIVSKPASSRTAGLLGRLVGSASGKDDKMDRSRRKYEDAVHRLHLLRNDYILQVHITNALHGTFYTDILPRAMKQMDGEYYVQCAGALNSYAEWETELAAVAQHGIQQLRAHAEQINRDAECRAFVAGSANTFIPVPPVFGAVPAHGDEEPLPFAQASDSDGASDGVRSALQDKLDQLVIAQANMQQAVGRKEKELASVQGLRDTYERNPSFGDSGEGTLDAVLVAAHELDVLQFTLSKIDAQVAALSGAGLTVHEHLALHRIVNGQAHAPAGSVSAGRPRRMSIIASMLGGGGASKDKAETSAPQQTTATVVIGSVKRASESLAAPPAALQEAITNASISAATLPRRYEAKALYNYEAGTGSELDLSENDKVYVLEELGGRDDGWVRCEREDGRRGLCPLNYIEVLGELHSATSLAPPIPGTTGAGTAGVAVTSAASIGTSSGTAAAPQWVEVVYEYTAVVDGELTIEPGEVVEVISTDTGSDEWWEGRVRGETGQFPTAYVRPFNPAEKAAAAMNVRSAASVKSDTSAGGAAANVSASTMPQAVMPEAALMSDQSLNSSMNTGSRRRRGSISGVRVRATHPYSIQGPGDLELSVGDEIIIFSEDPTFSASMSPSTPGSVWEGRNLATGKSGRFPASCVEKIAV